MKTLMALLISLVDAAPSRVLAALGIGWISYAGISSAVASITGAVQTAWGSMPAAVAQILGLAGFGQAIGVIVAAMTARASLSAIKRLGKLA